MVPLIGLQYLKMYAYPDRKSPIKSDNKALDGFRCAILGYYGLQHETDIY